MIDAFVEGVQSVRQVCHLVVLAPVALTIIAARGRWPAVAGAIVGVVIGGWFFVTNRFGNITDTELRTTATLMILLVTAMAIPHLFGEDKPAWLQRSGAVVQSDAGVGIASGAVALMVTQWWRPCVGVELGSILTNGPRDPWGQLLPSAGFMLGVALPLLVIGLVYAAANASDRYTQPLAWGGAALCGVLGLGVLAGQHGEIVAKLFQWSQ